MKYEEEFYKRIFKAAICVSVALVLYYLSRYIISIYRHTQYMDMYLGNGGQVKAYSSINYLQNSVAFHICFLLLFGITRLLAARRENDRECVEFLASLPVKRHERAIYKMKNYLTSFGTAYGIVFVLLLGVEFLDGIRISRIIPNIELSYGGTYTFKVLCLSFTLLLLEMAIVFLFETIISNKFVGLMLGAVGVVMIQTHIGSSYFQVNIFAMEYKGYKAITEISNFTIICLGLLVASLAISVVSIYLEGKVEYSKSGLFHFGIAKEIFLSILYSPILFLGIISRDTKERALLLLGGLLIILGINYLISGKQKDVKVGKIALTSLKIFCFSFIAIMLSSTVIERSTQRLHDWEYASYENETELFSDVEMVEFYDEESILQAMKAEQGAEFLYPTYLSQNFEFDKGVLSYSAYHELERVIINYFLLYNTPEGEAIVCSMALMHSSEKWANIFDVKETTKIVQHNKYGNILLGTFRNGRENAGYFINSINNENSFFDMQMYCIRGPLEEDDILEIIDSAK